MQQVLFTILLIFFILYVLLIIYYRRGWKAIPNYDPQTAIPIAIGIKPQTKITLIIPARNEEFCIGNCLDSITGQSYPQELFEVLVVDDHSTDRTAAIVQQYSAGNIKLVSLKDHTGGAPLNSYKKKAIETAIEQSSGTLIVTTDADCIVPRNWLLTIASFYEQYQPEFIAAPVAFLPSPQGEGRGVRFIEIFQALDFMTMQGITGASVHKKFHSMCNGANLAYTKKAFEAVDGFSGIDTIASGDDMLLMYKIYKRYPDKVLFLRSRDAIVQTAPVRTIREFFSQRIRWASKAGSYDDKRIFWVLLLVYLFNLALLILPFFALIDNLQFDIRLHPVTISITLAELWVAMIILKTIVEFCFLYPVARFFGRRKLLWLFPLMQPFHILYVVIAGWLGRFGSYTWKERRVK